MENETCEYCHLPLAPSVLPKKYDRDQYCWWRSFTGSSFEAPKMRDCLKRTAQRAILPMAGC